MISFMLGRTLFQEKFLKWEKKKKSLFSNRFWPTDLVICLQLIFFWFFFDFFFTNFFNKSLFSWTQQTLLFIWVLSPMFILKILFQKHQRKIFSSYLDKLNINNFLKCFYCFLSLLFSFIYFEFICSWFRGIHEWYSIKFNKKTSKLIFK